VKVTIVAEQLRRSVPGGIGTYTRGLLTGLRDVAPHLDVALHASRATARPDPLGAWAPWPVRASPLPGPLLTRAWDRGWLGPPRGRGDGVLHATSLAFPPPRRAPLTLMVHDVAWRQVPDAFPPRGRRWHEDALRRAVDVATRIVVPSDAVRQQVSAMAPVVVVEEGCDHLPSPDHVAARRLLTEAGLRMDAGYLLTVSTLEPRKNLRTLVAAYHRSELMVPLVVVGAKGWGDAIDVDDDDRRGVHLVGAVEDATLAALYAGALAFAYVPVVEGFGLPPVEAMHAGVPVVAGDAVPSVGDAALVVDSADADAIAGALLTVMSDDAVRARLIETGRRRAAQLTWAEAAKRHVALWEEVAAG
jgi:glycosyltransferase involved in cell wall biosynthesis